MFTLAHISDVHLGPLPRTRLGQLMGKRLLGYLNWQSGRKTRYRRTTREALIADMRAQKPDHIAVTGDLVNIALPGEFVQAQGWLQELGPPDRVTVVPGNHDAYVPVPDAEGLGRWSDYMRGSDDEPREGRPGNLRFPFVRRLGEIALIGLSSALPTPPFMASGALDEAQIAALPGLLGALGAEGCFRVVLVHHPPLPGQTSWRRALRNADALQDVLRAAGAELVLFGHNHVQSLDRLETEHGVCPVVGVPSASVARSGLESLARYNLFHIARTGNAWTCEMTGRGYHEPDGPVDQIERVRFSS